MAYKLNSVDLSADLLRDRSTNSNEPNMKLNSDLDQNINFYNLNWKIARDYIAGTGNDKIEGGYSADKLDGADGNDYLYGNFGNDTLIGGNGNDTLNGGAGSDRLDGGDGIDNALFAGKKEDYKYKYDATDGSVTVDYRGNGTFVDKMYNVEEISFTNGTKFAVRDVVPQLSMKFVADNNNINFADFARFNENIFDAGAGNDTITGGYYGDKLSGGTGNDRLSGGDGGYDTLLGGEGADTLIGGDGSDYVDGGQGEDVAILAFSNRDYTYARNDDGTIRVTYQAYSQVDTLKDVENVEFADGSRYKLDDLVNDSNKGNDYLVASERNGPLVGGEGDDTYLIDNGTAVVVEKAAEGYDKVILSSFSNLDTYTMADNIEEFAYQYEEGVGGDYYKESLTINGNDSDNKITGFESNDSLSGFGGNDTITADSVGFDTLDGGSGDDVLIAGTSGTNFVLSMGYDTIEGSAANEIIIVHGNRDDYTIDHDTGTDSHGIDRDCVYITNVMLEGQISVVFDIEQVHFIDGVHDMVPVVL